MTHSRIPYGMDVPDVAAEKPDAFLEDRPINRVTRDFSDVLNEIKGHLTRDELLSVSLFKNSKKPHNNQVYRAFFRANHGKELSSSAVTHLKNRLVRVLQHVGTLLRYKRDNNIDYLLKDILPKRQYAILMMYEKRWPLAEINRRIGNKHSSTTSGAFSRAMTKLQAETHPLIRRYLELLGIVLRFSRKRKIG